jgi:hypothetical protein
MGGVDCPEPGLSQSMTAFAESGLNISKPRYQASKLRARTLIQSVSLSMQAVCPRFCFGEPDAATGVT